MFLRLTYIVIEHAFFEITAPVSPLTDLELSTLCVGREDNAYDYRVRSWVFTRLDITALNRYAAGIRSSHLGHRVVLKLMGMLRRVLVYYNVRTFVEVCVFSLNE